MRFRMLPANGVPVSFVDLIKTYWIYFFTKRYNEFSEKFSEKVNQKYCNLTNSGRSALYIALKSLSSLRQGKNEVLMPEITCESVFYSILKSGLKPVFYEHMENTYEPDFKDIETKITDKTLCLIASPLFGININTIEFNNISNNKNIFLLVDCAQTLGTKYENKDLGYYGDLSIYSFGKSKSITTIDGGCLATNNENINDSIAKEYGMLKCSGKSDNIKLFLLYLINYLIIKPFFFNLLTISKVKFVNEKYDDKYFVKKMGIFQKSAGLVMLEKLEALNEIRRNNSEYILKRITNNDFIKPFEDKKSVFLRMPLLYKGSKVIEKLTEEMAKVGIYFRKSNYKNIIKSDSDDYFTNKIVLIPTHPYSRRKDLKNIINLINNF